MRPPLVRLHAAVVGALLAAPAAGTAQILSPLAIDKVVPPVACGPASDTNCQDAGWLTYCSPVTPPLHNADGTTSPACQPFLEDKLVALGVSQPAPTETYFKPKGASFRTGVPEDTFAVAVPPAPVGLMHKYRPLAGSWAAQEEIARVTAQNSLLALSVTGTGGWQRLWDTTPAYPIRSCENYVYRRFFEVERWIDAINACDALAATKSSDEVDRCKVAISLNGLGSSATSVSATPGIARHAMHDSEGRLISARLAEMAAQGLASGPSIDPFDVAWTLRDSIPKNPFYAGTEWLLVPALIEGFPAAEQPVLEALRNELHRGATLYDVTGKSGHQYGQAFVDADGGIHRGFADEWDFHNYMFNHFGSTTDAEVREYRRRVKALLEAAGLVADDFECTTIASNMIGGACGPGMPNALGNVLPGETQMWEDDPFQASAVLAAVMPAQLVATPAAFGLVGFGADLQPAAFTAEQFNQGAALTGGQAIPMSGHHPLTSRTIRENPRLMDQLRSIEAEPVLRLPRFTEVHTDLGIVNIAGPAPAAPPIDVSLVDQTAGVLNLMWSMYPPRRDTSVDYPRLDCRAILAKAGDDGREVGETDGRTATGIPVFSYENEHWYRRWVDACRMTNVVLDEWGRKLAARPSCLDPKSTKCDWAPASFVDRFVTRFVGYGSVAKESEYRFCRRWTNGGQVETTVDLAKRYQLDAFTAALDARRVAFEAKFKRIPIKAKDDFGLNRFESDSIGGDMFGGGYQYSLAWHTKVEERTPDVENLACRLGGNAMASFKANATLFGTAFPVLDLYANASANQSDTGVLRAKSWIKIVGYTIADTGGWLEYTGQVHADYLQADAEFEDATLFRVPFQVSFLTVTVSGGVTYGYGATTTFAMDQAPQGACPKGEATPGQSAFRVNAELVPFAELGGWVDADVSLAGIIGVGLEVELTLLRLSLPMRAVNALLPEPGSNELAVTFDADLDLALDTLKGSLSVYLEAFWTHIFSIKLVDWDGFRYVIPIFETPPTRLGVWELGGGAVLPPGDTGYDVP